MSLTYEASLNRVIEADRACAVPYPLVVDQFHCDAPGLIRMATAAAVSATNEIVVTLASHWAWFDVDERVRATCGDLTRGPTESRMSIVWLADAGKRILPGVDGVITLRPIPQSCTNLHFAGRFVPPHGLLGSTGGVVLGRQVAEAAIEHLLDRLVEHIEQSEPTPIPPNLTGSLRNRKAGDSGALVNLEPDRWPPPGDGGDPTITTAL